MKGIAKILWGIVALVIISAIAGLFIAKVANDEKAIADIVSSNYRMMNTVEFAKIFLRQNLAFTAEKVAKDVAKDVIGGKADWDEIFSDDTKLQDFKTRLESEFKPRYRARHDTTIRINNLKVSGRKIIFDYYISVIHEYRALEKDERIILEF